MRTISIFEIDSQSIVTTPGSAVEHASGELIDAFLREERILPEDQTKVPRREQMVAGFGALSTAYSGKSLPTDPEGDAITAAANKILPPDPAVATHDPQSVHLSVSADELFKQRALRNAIALLAQIPSREVPEAVQTIHALIHDAESDAFGLVFQGGVRFTVRMRHNDPERLRAATERLVSAVAPRTNQAIEPLLRDIHSIRAIRKYRVHFYPIEMKTPIGEMAQKGIVHAVTSQVGLLRSLALESAQAYLLALVVLLLGLDLVFEFRWLPRWDLQGLSLTSWLAGIWGRLATGAFGAYLVTLSLRYGELRRKLRSRYGSFRRGAYGAFIEWHTSDHDRGPSDTTT